jgi:hypothetical protein
MVLVSVFFRWQVRERQPKHRRDDPSDESLSSLCINYVPWFNVFALCCFWCSFCLPKGDWAVVSNNVYMFPAAVLVISIIGAVVTVLAPAGKSFHQVFNFIVFLFVQVMALFVGDAYVPPFAAFYVLFSLLR